VPEKFIYEAHRPGPSGVTGLPWPVCVYCGLVYLRNPFTAWAIKKGCNNADHPEFPRELAKTAYYKRNS
jgi:hypothetical protein